MHLTPCPPLLCRLELPLQLGVVARALHVASQQHSNNTQQLALECSSPVCVVVDMCVESEQDNQ